MAKYPNCRQRQIGGKTYWVARLVFQRDPVTNLRPRPKDFSAKSAAEAVRKREVFLKEYKRNPNADRETTFAQFIESDFVPFVEAQYNAAELSWGRFSERRSRLKRFVLEHDSGQQLCRTALANVTPELLERYFDRLLRAGLSANRRNMVRQDLMLALRKAKRRLPFPVSEYFTDIPQAREERKRKALFNPEDVLDRIYDDERDSEARLVVAFEFIMNCRPNEMFALTWTDIDWRAQTVSIYKAVQRDRTGFKINGATKTGRKGDRLLPLPELLIDLLRRTQRQRMAEGRSSEYVFCDKRGRPYDKDSFANEWARIRKSLDMPDGPTFYSLKTTGNSYALANGVSSAAQAKKMGHTSTRMADNTYRHLMNAEIVNAVEVYSRRTASVRGENRGEKSA